MSSHSPGPWKIWSDAWDIQVRGQADVRTADGRLVAAVFRRNDTNDRECEANARLIAAAPELLEALRAAAREAAYSCTCSRALHCGGCDAAADAWDLIRRIEGET